MYYFRMYIVCFCKSGDLLSQWRGYGVDQGYALGFDKTKLASLNIGEIAPVQYGIPNPKDFFDDELKTACHPTAHPGTYDYFSSRDFLPRIAKIKHPGFAEEKEWRIMTQLAVLEDDIDNPKIKFRPSKMGPISYLAHTFTHNCLKEIVIGPGEYSTVRENAVRNLLNHYHFEKVHTRISTIPLREI